MTDTTQSPARLTRADLPQHVLDDIESAHKRIEQLVALSNDQYLALKLLKERADHPLLLAQAVQADGGHISIEVGTTAKGDYTYSAKAVIPIITADAAGQEAATMAARFLALQQIEVAVGFLRERYSQKAAS